jgi:hypothetical protein
MSCPPWTMRCHDSRFVNRGDLHARWGHREILPHAITHKWLHVFERQSEKSKPLDEADMEGDDGPDRPLDINNLNNPRIVRLMGLVFPSNVDAASTQEREFRNHEARSVLLGEPVANLANEAWLHGSAEDVREDRRLILDALVVSNRNSMRSVNLGYHFLTSIGPNTAQ